MSIIGNRSHDPLG